MNSKTSQTVKNGTFMQVGELQVEKFTGLTHCPHCQHVRAFKDMHLCGGFDRDEVAFICTQCFNMVKEYGIYELGGGQ